MNLDAKGFKKISSDAKSTILRHPDGHEIKVAHAALSPDLKKRLAKIPQHFADGGEVQDQPSIFDKKETEAPWYARNLDENDPASPKYKQPQEDNKAGDAVGSEIVSNMANQYAPETEAARNPAQEEPTPLAPDPSANTNSVMYGAQNTPAPQATLAPAPAAPVNPDPYGTDEYLKNSMGAINEAKAGINLGAKAESQQAKDEMAAANQNIQDMTKLNQDYQKHAADLTNEYNSVVQDVKNGHINPKNYMESMSSGQKVGTAIGLILSGMGSALAGQENMAQKFLTQQIDRDVAAQQAELGKKENLLNANMRQFGNLRDATDMTRAMQMGIYSSQIKAAALKSADPMAKAKALQASAPLDQQAAQLMQQTAMRRTAMNGMQGNQNNPAMQIRLLGMTGMMPEADQKEASKELGKVKEIETLRGKMHGVYDQLNKKFLAGAMSPNDRDSFVNTYGGILAKAAEGRFNLEESKQQMRALLPSGGEDLNTRKDKLRNLDGFFDALGAGTTPTLEKYPQIKIPKYQAIEKHAPQIGK